ncbi:MAG: cytochrome b/b6 domain-containing protein [Bacteroidota bacterium]
MSDRLYFYPIWIRIWHWTNALCFLTLIVTGFSMQYSNPEAPLIPFAFGVKVHSYTGFVLTFSYFFFFFGNIFSRNGRFYKMYSKGMINSLIKQGMYYAFGIFKGEPHPYPLNKDRKFNPLQQFTYIFAMYIALPLMVISGLALYWPKIFNLLGIGSLILMDITHVIMGVILTVFMAIHLYICTLGHSPLSNFKSMFNGWHEVHE